MVRIPERILRNAPITTSAAKAMMPERISMDLIIQCFHMTLMFPAIPHKSLHVTLPKDIDESVTPSSFAVTLQFIGNRRDAPANVGRIANPTYAMHHIWWSITATPREPKMYRRTYMQRLAILFLALTVFLSACGSPAPPDNAGQLAPAWPAVKPVASYDI